MSFYEGNVAHGNLSTHGNSGQVICLFNEHLGEVYKVDTTVAEIGLSGYLDG